MSLTIPDDLLEAAHLTETEMLQELAVTLFQKERLTLAQSARLAGVDRLTFQRLLASRRIPLHYDVPELEADVQTLRDLGRL
jgi:predicted HTH domain antitoxin